jgi:hypothetical protein
MPSGHAHDPHAHGIEVGNTLGDRSSVRQSRYFRQYESGNAVKGLLGTPHLQWDETKKQGAYEGHTVYEGDEYTAVAHPQHGRRANQQPPRPPAHQQPAVPMQQSQQVPQQQPWQQQHGRRPGSRDLPPTQQQPEADGLASESAAAAAAAASHGRRAARGPGAAFHDPNGDELWSAVGARDRTEVARLLARGGDPNMVCPDGWVRAENAPKDGAVGRSLLHHAAWAGDLSIFKLLIESGADVHRQRNTAWRPNGGVRGRGATSLHHAVMYNRLPIVRYLLEELMARHPQLPTAVSPPTPTTCTAATADGTITSAAIRTIASAATAATGTCAAAAACLLPGADRHPGRAGVHAAAPRGQVQLP